MRLRDARRRRVRRCRNSWRSTFEGFGRSGLKGGDCHLASRDRVAQSSGRPWPGRTWHLARRRELVTAEAVEEESRELAKVRERYRRCKLS